MIQIPSICNFFACLAYFHNIYVFAPSAVKKGITKVFFFIIVVISNSTYIFAQETKVPEIIRDIAEDLAASDEEGEESQAYLDRLYDLSEDPVRINSGDEAEISRLFFLSGFQVKALTDYTRTEGKILSFNELANIPGFDQATAELIIPFCTLAAGNTSIADSLRIRNFLTTNFSLKRGKQDTVSPGSDWKILTRYKFTAGSFTGGFTLEKDPGEKFLVPGTFEPDFCSAALEWTGKGIVRKVILGDFSCKAGQGININSGLSTGLSLASMSYISADEIKPYTSTDENNFFRGIATSLSYRKSSLTIFYSRNKIDATRGSSGGQSEDFVESLYKSGLHNTTGSLSKKDVVIESVMGLNLSYNFRYVRIGLVYSQELFSLPFRADPGDPDKIHAFSGNRVSVGSLYYNGMIKNILLYGEISANDLKRFSIVQGLSFKPSGRLMLNLIFWHYGPGFTSFHGKGPGGSNVTCQEQSVMGNFTFEAARHLFLSGGYSLSHYPWLKYRCSSPSSGTKRQLRLKYNPSDGLTLDLLYNYRLSMADVNNSDGIPVLKQMITRNVKAALRFPVYENLTLGTRIDFTAFKPSGSKGIQLLQDLAWKSGRVPLSLWLRYSIFRTDDYDSRIYTWENDLLYAFSIPSYHGKGSRFYILTSYKISGKAEVRFKYGVITRSEAGMRDSDEIKIQIRIVI